MAQTSPRPLRAQKTPLPVPGGGVDEVYAAGRPSAASVELGHDRAWAGAP